MRGEARRGKVDELFDEGRDWPSPEAFSHMSLATFLLPPRQYGPDTVKSLVTCKRRSLYFYKYEYWDPSLRRTFSSGHREQVIFSLCCPLRKMSPAAEQHWFGSTTTNQRARPSPKQNRL